MIADSYSHDGPGFLERNQLEAEPASEDDVNFQPCQQKNMFRFYKQ